MQRFRPSASQIGIGLALVTALIASSWALIVPTEAKLESEENAASSAKEATRGPCPAGSLPDGDICLPMNQVQHSSLAPTPESPLEAEDAPNPDKSDDGSSPVANSSKESTTP